MSLLPKSSSETTDPILLVASESPFDIILYSPKRDKALCLVHFDLVCNVFQVFFLTWQCPTQVKLLDKNKIRIQNPTDSDLLCF